MQVHLSESELSEFEASAMDPTYSTVSPESTSSSQNSPKTNTSINVQPTLQSVYLVFESALLMLFVTCRFCTSTSTNVKKFIIGSFLRIRQYCTVCKRAWSWESQPFVGTVPAGNILTSAAILFSGAFPAKVLRIFQILNCAMITPKTFFRHQAKFLQPAIHITWEKHQMALCQSFKANNQNLALSGDGRADSPGHSAKYGSYTVMEMSCNKVLDFKLVQSNEVGGSYHMEKEGLARVLNFLQQQGLRISVLVTDRHRQINKWLRENHSEITHYYDVWHVAKGLHKKLEAVSKQKDCEIIGRWQKSIVNHLYWCVASTPNGNGDIIKAKWLSLENHVHNVHIGHGIIFPECAHGQLSGSGKKKWFKRHTKSSEKLTAIMTSTTLCKDLTRLSPEHQTSSLEAFHSVIIHFAPKYVPLSYPGMQCRLQLAALHFNENSSRQQAVTQCGEKRYSIMFPKFKKGGYIVRKVTVEPTYHYIHDLLEETIRQCKEDVPPPSLSSSVPDSLCSEYDRPDKAIAISKHRSRFNPK